MEPLEYLRILRRRKWFVALAVLVGVIAGWVTAPGASANRTPSYQATHTLILNPAQTASNNNPKSVNNLSQSALLVTTGVIPQNVAAKVGNGADPVALTKKVKATPDPTLGTIDITVTDSDPAYAVELADDFAQALVDDLSSDSIQRWQQQHDSLESTVNDLNAQIAALEGTFDPKVQSAARSQYNALDAQRTTANTQLAQLNAAGPPPATFTTLQSARALPKSEGLHPPNSKPARALLLAFIGLALGIGLAFAAERLETRLTTKRSAEDAFGLPVVAEIPNLPRKRRHQGELMTASQPAAPFVEAYRGLRTMVLLRSLDQTHDTPPTGADQSRRGRVLVVVSAGASEGKTTTTAHLAALLAEAGHSVLVVSADFRRPRVHELFAVRGEPGLSDVLAQHDPVPLRSLDLSTPVKGVKLLPSGLPIDNPSALLGATVELMRGARPLFDFIIVDTAPLLVANDASELIRAADMVLMVGRARRTSIDACGRSAELLRRIDAPVIGVVLVGASDMPTAYRYYRYRYYGASSPPTLTQRLFGSRSRRVQATRDEPATVADAPAAPEAPPSPVSPSAPAPAPMGERRRRRQGKSVRGKESSMNSMLGTDASAAEWDTVEVTPTNGSSDHEPVDDSLVEFWQEFKERR